MTNIKFIFLSSFLLFNTLVFSQKERVLHRPNFDEKFIHFGFYLGVNQNDFKLNYKASNFPSADVLIEAKTGFNIGLIADIRLHNNINLRFEPGLLSNTKTITFNHLSAQNEKIRETGSTYLHLPLVFKFSTNRLDNVRPYVIAGLSYDANLSSNERNTNDNSAGEFRMKTHNLMYEVGLGIDFYLYYFKFSPSIRGVFAFNNELKDDVDLNSKWTSPINFLGTRGVFLNLSFE